MGFQNILQLPVQTGVNGSEYLPIVSGLGNAAVTRRVQIGLISGFTAGTTPQNAGTVYAGPSTPGAAAAPPTFTPTVLVGTSITIAGTAGVDPAASLGINLNTAVPVSSGENPAIHNVGAPATIFRTIWDTFAQQTGLIFRRADGTISGLSPLVLGDVIMNMTARGWRGDRYTTGGESSASFEFWAAENWSPTNTGGLSTWRTTAIGTTGTSLYRMGLLQGLIVGSPTSNTPTNFVDPGVGNISAYNGLVVGNSTATPFYTVSTTGPIIPAFQVHGTTASANAGSNTRWSADANAAQQYLVKSRGATIGTRGALLVNDNIGSIFFSGDDGTNFQSSSVIRGTVDGAVSAGIIPGRLMLMTVNSSGVLTEAMRVDSSQRVGIGIAPTGLALLETKGFIGNTCAVFSSDVRGVAIVESDPTVGLNAYYNTTWKAIQTGGGVTLGATSTGIFQLQAAVSVTGQGTSFTMNEMLRVDPNNAGRITQAAQTAIPAGGTNHLGYCFSSTADFGIFFGSGAPTLSAAQGSIYLRSDGTINNRMYINVNGSTTWTAFNTTA